MSVYIISTMTGSVVYPFYDFSNKDLPVIRDKVTIHGGAHLPSNRSGFGEMGRDDQGVPMWTADGVVTPITDAQYELLKDHPLFKKHQDRGHLRVVNRDIKDDHKAVKKEVRTMEEFDGHAQLTPETAKKKTRLKVTTGQVGESDDGRYRI